MDQLVGWRDGEEAFESSFPLGPIHEHLRPRKCFRNLLAHGEACASGVSAQK